MPSSRQTLASLKLSAVAVAAFIAALNPTAVSARDEPVDRAAATRAQLLTNQLIAAIGEYRRASSAQRSAATSKLLAVARERRALLLSTIEAHPGFTFRQVMPNGLITGLPVTVQQLIEQEVDLTGRIVGEWGDDMVRRVSSHTYFLETSPAQGSARYRLHAADAPDRPGNRHPADRLVGETVNVRAVELDGHLLIGGAGAITTTESTSTSGTSGGGGSISGTQNTLVLLGNFKDRALDSSCSTTYVHGHMFGASNSVADLYKQTSNNAVTFAGGVYGTYTMSANSTDACSFSTWAAQLDDIAAKQGINVSSYPRRVYVIPPNSCGYSGYGTYGGSPSRAYMMYCQYTDLYAHELGHNLNFRHANSGGEYNDYSDVMGGSGAALRQLNAPNKVNAGWIGSSKVVNVNGPGQFTIDATANVSGSNPQVLIVPKPDTNDNYYLSLRQAIGYDTNLSGSYVNRVSIHRASTSTTMPTELITTLGAGESYSDSKNGYQFSVSSIGSSATVSVNMATATCTRSAPSVSISPYSQSAAPGNSVSYQITVTNKNNSGCGTSTFSFTGQIPSGWSNSHSPATISLGSGASASTVWTVTSPNINIAEQTYTIGSTTYDTGATNSATTVQGNYIVTAPDGILPSVEITSPTGGSSVSGTVTISANAADNVGVAKVEFWVGGTLLGSDTSAPYSISWNTKNYSGSQTLTAKAFDAAGNAATSNVVTVSVTAGSSKPGLGKGRK
jgi:hypothetical protein